MTTNHRVAAGSALHDHRMEAATAHALLAIHDLLDERLPKPKTIDHALNLDAFKHELETPMREHGECCEPDDLPGEPVTLPRDDVEALLNHGVLTVAQRTEALRRIREALRGEHR